MDLNAKIEELKQDLEELKSHHNKAIRQRVKNVLDVEIKRVTTEIAKLEETKRQATSAVSAPVRAEQQRYQVKLNNYAWDQSDKFVKFYVTLDKVQTVPAEDVFCTFTDKSVELHVKNLDDKDYFFTITNLLHNIDPEKSNWKVKTDMVLINAAKVSNVQWSHVTQFEKKAKDAKALNDGDDKADPSDPQGGLMNLMKKMYNDGDDEMKRTIAKAWTESQSKMHETQAFD